MTKWSLVDAMSPVPPARRRFFVPLASEPIDGPKPAVADLKRYSIDVGRTETQEWTSEIWLTISIRAPQSGGLAADPLSRLHSIDRAEVRFEPQQGNIPPRLILKMLTFSQYGFSRASFPTWFRRWEDAASIPGTVVYENVDTAQLTSLLQAIEAPPSVVPPEDRVEPRQGLFFPAEVTSSNRAGFVDAFLSGDAEHCIYASAGAVLGAAAHDPDPQNASARLLKLRAYYSDHTSDRPHPMSPCELLNLLFGSHSAEATSQALLLRMEQLGTEAAEAGMLPTRTLALRPPLRTWKRVEWEAKQELGDTRRARWAQEDSTLQNAHFYNGCSRTVGGTTVRFNTNADQYRPFNKCNLFASEVCLRAGFRVPVWLGGTETLLYYYDANSYSNSIAAADLVYANDGDQLRFAILGRQENEERPNGRAWPWAYWLYGELRGLEIRDQLNRLMREEGRCLLVAGARRRRFTGCAGTFRSGGRGTGHVVVLSEATEEPLLRGGGAGLEEFTGTFWEALGTSGAVESEKKRISLIGKGKKADDPNGFVRLHIVELAAGGDPDSRQGLRSLNVLCDDRNLVGTRDEAAANKQCTRADGTVWCWHDDWPTQDTATEAPCP